MANENSYEAFEARINQIKEELKEEQKKFIIYKLKKIMELIINNNKSFDVYPYQIDLDEETENQEIDEDYTLDDDELNILSEMLRDMGLIPNGNDFFMESEYDDYFGNITTISFRIEEGMLTFYGGQQEVFFKTEKELIEENDSKFKKLHKKVDLSYFDRIPTEVQENERVEENSVKTRKQLFEESLLRDDVVEYFLSKTPEEIEEELGAEVARMIDYEQKNSHHCYDLWEHTLRTVEGIKKEELTYEQFKKLRIAAFFHDIGKPNVAKFNEKTGQQVFYGHAMHSVDVAKPILQELGYSEEEIEQICFYIGHHDDFISYKSKTEPWMKSHEFIRAIDSDTVSEKIIENQYDFEAMGYDSDQIRYICYVLGHSGEQPNFTTKDGPKIINVNMAEVQEKIDSGKYNAKYIPTEEDYKLLLELCKADAGAQSEIAMQNGKKVGSKKEKLENMNNIQNCIPEAFEKWLEETSNGNPFVAQMLRYATRRVEVREQDEQAEKLEDQYKGKLPKKPRTVDDE